MALASVLCTFEMKALRAVVRAFSISQSAIDPFRTFWISSSSARSTSATALPGRAIATIRKSPGPRPLPANAPTVEASSFCRTSCSCNRELRPPPSTVPSTDKASSSGEVAGGIL